MEVKKIKEKKSGEMAVIQVANNDKDYTGIDTVPKVIDFLLSLGFDVSTTHGGWRKKTSSIVLKLRVLIKGMVYALLN